MFPLSVGDRLLNQLMPLLLGVGMHDSDADVLVNIGDSSDVKG